MNTLPQTTEHRLKKIPQVPAVWEGDRRPLAGMMNNLEPELQDHGECIVWVDASQGFVRSMEIVRDNTGPEVMVRALLKAIEAPHSPAEASRPQKIVVRDRQLQFFLRGVLQNLDIEVDYVPNLVLIDELWQNFEAIHPKQEKDIPSQLEDLLDEIALEIWDQEPWLLLADHDIISIELNLPEIDRLYACVMGMLGQEYGIILYRSLDSLKRFRSSAFNADDDCLDSELESAFLQQDCWFLNFSAVDEDSFDFGGEINLGDLLGSEIQPFFGSIHPYEGMSTLRDEEEFLPIYVALQALKNFVDDHEDDLLEDTIDSITEEYNLDLPIGENYPVKVSTMPELATELIEILEEAEAQEEMKLSDDTFILKNDLIPRGSIIVFTIISWQLLTALRQKKKFYLSELETDLLESMTDKADGFPVIIVQTTRPKAKKLIEELDSEGGIDCIAFNHGVDEYEEIDYDIGILKTPQNNLYIFSQFPKRKSNLSQALRKWQKEVKKIDGFCGLLIAMGVTGNSRNNPQFRDLLGLFQTKFINDLGIGTLTLDFD